MLAINKSWSYSLGQARSQNTEKKSLKSLYMLIFSGCMNVHTTVLKH